MPNITVLINVKYNHIVVINVKYNQIVTCQMCVNYLSEYVRKLYIKKSCIFIISFA